MRKVLAAGRFACCTTLRIQIKTTHVLVAATVCGCSFFAQDCESADPEIRQKTAGRYPPQTSDFWDPSAAKSPLAVEAAHGCRGSDLESSIVFVSYIWSAGTEREISMSVVTLTTSGRSDCPTSMFTKSSRTTVVDSHLSQGARASS